MSRNQTETSGDFNAHTFKTTDGLQIEYREYRPSGEFHSIPVICLHGLTRNLRDFEDLAPMIAERGFRAIVPSQRGRGGSDYDPNPERYQPDQYATDMKGLLDALGIEQAIFVGSSMGGIITMLLSERHPNLVRAAVLNDIGIDLDPVGVARIMGYVGLPSAFASWQEAAEACRDGNGHAFPKETSAEYWMKFARRVCQETTSGQISYAYDLAIAVPTQTAHAAVPDYAKAFATLRNEPVLLVRGQTSDLLSVSTVEKMKALHPELEYMEVPDVGHVPFLTEKTAWPRVAAFLDAQR